jgi:oxygen-independent coproporphyrinogen-3 oxidase
VEEALMMGLRLAEGIERTRFAEQTGVDPVTALSGRGLEPLIAAGYLDVDAHRLAATSSGRQRLNAVLERLIT